jgi:hypothetical protein
MSIIYIDIEDLKKLKIKYTEKLERYKLNQNEEYDRIKEKLKEIEKELKRTYSKYCPNYDSDLDE